MKWRVAATMVALLQLPVSAMAVEEVPILRAGETRFSAMGSAQGRFRITEELVLQVSSRSDDTQLRSDAPWAALVVQSVSPTRSSRAAFVAYTDPACSALLGVPPCEVTEMDHYMGGATTSDSGILSQRHLLRPGVYAVSLLGSPGARIDARLVLSYESSPPQYWDLPELQPPSFGLSEPTAGALTTARVRELGVSKGWSGGLEAEMESQGDVLVGRRFHWRMDSFLLEEEPHYLYRCTRAGSKSDCGSWSGDRHLLGTGLVLSGDDWLLDVEPGVATYDWEWRSTTNTLDAWAWMLAWPYVT